MDAVVKEEEESVNEESNMIEPKEEVIDESVELKEPKVELIDERDVKMEELNEDEYQHLIPYEYRDYLEQNTEKEQLTSSENEPANKRKRRTEQETPFKKKTAECQVCQKMFVLDCFKTAVNHAGTHTNFIRFSCSVEGCDYKCWPHQNATSHMKYKHKIIKPTLKDLMRIELSDEENVELRRMVKECFPEVTQTTRKRNPPSLYIFNCQICNVSISEPSMWTTFKRRNHAFIHTDIMLYECIEPECDFKTKYFKSFRHHQTSKHGKIAEMIKNVKRILPPEEVLKIEEMVDQCFPVLKGTEARSAEFEGEKLEEKRQSPAKQRQKPVDLSTRCDVCYKTLRINHLESKDFRRFHALSHTDIKLYKCCQIYCNYKARDRFAIINHQKWMHRMNMNDIRVIKIELTTEQERDIEEVMFQCFPKWNNE